MLISTKGRYAVRILLDIAIHDQEKPVALKDVATRQEISLKYSEQIISTLVRAGFVQSIRGAQGGYRLTKKPEEYTVGMVLRLTEKNMSPVVCIENGEEVCQRKHECVSIRIWKELDDAIKGVIDKYTLRDLMEWQTVSGCATEKIL